LAKEVSFNDKVRLGNRLKVSKVLPVKNVEMTVFGINRKISRALLRKPALALSLATDHSN